MAASTRRSVFLAVSVAAIILTMKCGSVRQPARDGFCAGKFSPSRPFICIDEKTLMASPDPARVFDVEGRDGHPTSAPVVIHWFTERSVDLEIVFADKSCTDEVRCDSGGHCTAIVKPLDVDASGKKMKRQCRYDVKIGDQKYDPELVVNPCCW